jgi:hypothetical protein
MITQIKKIQPLVEDLLRRYPILRDNDNRLFANILVCLDDNLRDNKDATADYVLSSLATGKYPSLESITRARRKIQETIPELRGNKYKSRMNSEKEVRDRIND